ncbi:hypothetical protein E2C01_087456 [Portunus trituberculatus]|uniref:Ig-like domain-containing protein n=1 Tax=Portunus trituberculatus TaxID=210409 RepID=A0A5B7J6M5_PORTR|nr:hypothetical protein [Portunus trituberculatus]
MHPSTFHYPLVHLHPNTFPLPFHNPKHHSPSPPSSLEQFPFPPPYLLNTPQLFTPRNTFLFSPANCLLHPLLILPFFLYPSPRSPPTGSPPPRILWYFGDRLIDSQMDEDPTDNMLRPGPTNTLLQGSHTEPARANTLTLGPFTRSDLKRLVTCEVTNTNLTSPLSAAVMIDMNRE